MKQLLLIVGLLFVTSAFADTTTNMLNTLCDKGTLSPEDCKQLKETRDEETKQGRAVRRAAALRDAQAAEAKEKAKSNAVGIVKDGTVSFETADGNVAFAPTMRLQLDYRSFGGDAAGITADTFDIRRAFLGLKGRFYQHYDWLIVGDFSSNGTSVLDEGYLNVNYWKYAQFRFGQFKVPFSLEERTSDLFTDFMERSMGNTMVPNKERGVMLHGIPYVGTTYGVGLTTGAGKNNIDVVNTVDSTDAFFAGTVNFSEIAGWKNTVTHIGAGYTTGTQPAGAAVSGRTEARGLVFFTPSAFPGVDVERTRTNVEGAFAYNNFKVQGEMTTIDYTGQGFSKGISSSYVDLMWFITGEKYADFYKDGKFDRTKPLKNFDSSTFSGGAWEVGVRFSQFNADDFAKGPGAITAPTTRSSFATSASSITLGVNFTPNPRTRISLNYVDTKFDTPVTVTQTASNPQTGKADGEKAIIMRLQYDF